MGRLANRVLGGAVRILTLIAAVSALTLTLARVVSAQSPIEIQRPKGIYGVVNIEESTKIYHQLYDGKSDLKSAPPTLEDYLKGLYSQILENPAVSGLAIWVNWSLLNPGAPGFPDPYDWKWLDDVFAQIDEWDSENPGKPGKTVQLVPLPGFNSPDWLKNELASCDFLFTSTTLVVGSPCSEATFWGFVEGGDTGGTPSPMVLPLPWDTVYKDAWQTFLTELDFRYESKPGFVSISVAGPTASSEEMILPAKQNTDPNATQPGGLPVTLMWDRLLRNQYSGQPAYLETDQAFIDEWNNAIKMYGSVFFGVTLIVTTGDGLPNLTSCAANPDLPACTFPSDSTTTFSKVCPTVDMDCVTETTILSDFDHSTTIGINGKATQTDGMRGSSSAADNLGVPSAKLISTTTRALKSGPVLGGAQFAKSFSKFTVEEGCTAVFPPKGAPSPVPVQDIPPECLAPGVTTAELAAMFTNFDQQTEAAYLISPEQAEYNVLLWLFNGTSAGPYFGAPAGNAPLNYLQIYGDDIIYATEHASVKVPVIVPGGSVNLSAQDLLNLASSALLSIAEHP